MEKIELVKVKGPTSVSIEVGITEEGDLLFSGQDIGEAPELVFGDADHEYWLRVPAAQKDRVLLALIAHCYTGNLSLVSEIRDLLRAQDIPCDFKTY